jgi:Glycosyltransferase family 17
VSRTVYECFIFGDEADMLECHLENLEQFPHVRHVISEARLDHQGNPKPLYYADNKSRYDRWNDRIHHVVAELPTSADSPYPWAREHTQRDALFQVIHDADPDDLILLTDTDEILAPAALDIMPRSMAALEMQVSMFAVDYVCPAPSRIAVGALRKNLGVPLWYMRDNGPRSSFEPFKDCGRHFTWLGGPDAIEKKLGQFCHGELADLITGGNKDGLWYEGGWTWEGASGQYPPGRADLVPQGYVSKLDETWPAYIRERRCPPSWFAPTWLEEN